MDELDDIIKEIEEKIKTAEEGLKIIQEGIGKEDEKPVLNRGIQPMTRLRGNIEEAKDAQENPEIQEIIDSFSDIGR